MQWKMKPLLVTAGALLAVLTWVPPGAAYNPVNRLPLLELDIRPLAGPPDAQPRRMVVQPGRPSQLRFETDWEGVGEVGLEIVARAEPVGDEGALRLTLESLLTLPDGRVIEASRQAAIRQRGTILFELFRHEERPFTLAIGAAVTETWEVVQTPSVGARVRFDVEVVRVEGIEKTSLERNQLNTFVNSAVRYEFSRGPELTDEKLALSLTPVRLIDDLVEIKINVAGRLPGEDGMTIIARDESMVVSRGATFPLTVTIGDPPLGYRFQVTPRF